MLIFLLLIYLVNLAAAAAVNVRQNEIISNTNLVHLQPSRRIELLQMANIQRQDRLQQVCNSRNLTSKTYHALNGEQLEHLIVDKQHKLLYCYIPKVACTNWKRVMMLMSGKWSEQPADPLRIPGNLAHSIGMFDTFSDLSATEKEDVLANYTRFMVVRHPFERLLSAFRNKFEGDLPSAKYFQMRMGRLIIKNLRPHATNESLARGHDVTFDEFIRYLLIPELSRSYQANSSFNEHWESMAHLCHPCIFRYNLIGKYETLQDDAALLLDTIGVKNVTFPMVKTSGVTATKLIPYFEDLPIRTIRNLYKLYEIDFKMFDYGLEDILGLELG